MFLKNIQNYTCFIRAYTHHNFVLPWLKVQTDCKKADRRWYKRRWWLFFQSSPASKSFFIKERFEIEQTRFFSILQVGCGKYYLLNKQWVVGLGSLIDLRPRKIGRQGYKKVSDIRLSSLKSYCVLRWCTWKW